jgi:hypothetical protein
MGVRQKALPIKQEREASIRQPASVFRDKTHIHSHRTVATLKTMSKGKEVRVAKESSMGACLFHLFSLSLSFLKGKSIISGLLIG